MNMMLESLKVTGFMISTYIAAQHHLFIPFWLLGIVALYLLRGEPSGVEN